MIYVGIDMHAKNMTIAAIKDNGELLPSQKITCHEMALERFFDEIGKPVQAVVEATANLYWISDWCHATGKVPTCS
ncbi:hypothetical protein QA596_12810 [Balneolales bacterium ANBcel1]|nr:hypothetical protein [Balneolales bacterium ANBcel1]